MTTDPLAPENLLAFKWEVIRGAVYEQFGIDLNAELVRLRKIEEAAEALIVVYPPDWIETKGSPALRALQKAVHG